MSTEAAPPSQVEATKQPRDFELKRFHVDLGTRTVRCERIRCEDIEDVLGGAARAAKRLAGNPVTDPYDPSALLILNLGLLTGSPLMTSLRTFFHAYSPLKRGASGKPGAAWTAGSGKFGTKLRALGIDEVVFKGRSESGVLLHLTPDKEASGGVRFDFEDAEDLRGKTLNGKIQELHGRWPQAHFAVIGPGGESYEHVRYAAIGLSTENQLKTGDAKTRFCGRCGIGGVMGSKNLLAIAADTPDAKPSAQPPAMKPINQEVARGKGSSRFRDKSADGGGGTWANYEALNPVHAMPEYNFVPTGTDVSFGLWRDEVEKGPHSVKAEACYRCGIKCHKNVYDANDKYLAKLDFEPLNLCSSNMGIFDIDQACTLVELIDELGMDSISCAVSVSYAMEYNKRHPDAPIAGGVAYGDFEGAHRVIEEIGHGKLPLLGLGSKHASEQLGDTGYAMHCKGVELPAYLPHTNPGYPFALAGGHMSMRTYLLLLYERETSLDYWVEAITERGWMIMRDDLTGACKFCALPDEMMVDVIRAVSGLDVDVAALKRAVLRTYLRGYKIERRQGFSAADYSLPAEAHLRHDQIQLPYFITDEFFAELRTRVLARFDELLAAERV